MISTTYMLQDYQGFLLLQSICGVDVFILDSSSKRNAHATQTQLLVDMLTTASQADSKETISSIHSLIDRIAGPEFALVLVAPGSKSVICMTDHAASFPIYYRRTKNCIAISDSLMRSNLQERSLEIDPSFFRTYLSGLTSLVKLSDRTPFKDVASLPPDSLATIGVGSKSVSYAPRRPIVSLQSASEQSEAPAKVLLSRIEQSVASYTREPGGRVCVSLSGGIDSTFIASMAKRIGCSAVKAVTFDTSKDRDFDGLEFAKYVANHLGVECFILNDADLRPFGWVAGEPFRHDMPHLMWLNPGIHVLRVRAAFELGSTRVLTGNAGEVVAAVSARPLWRLSGLAATAALRSPEILRSTLTALVVGRSAHANVTRGGWRYLGRAGRKAELPRPLHTEPLTVGGWRGERVRKFYADIFDTHTETRISEALPYARIHHPYLDPDVLWQSIRMAEDDEVPRKRLCFWRTNYEGFLPPGTIDQPKRAADSRFIRGMRENWAAVSSFLRNSHAHDIGILDLDQLKQDLAMMRDGILQEPERSMAVKALAIEWWFRGLEAEPFSEWIAGSGLDRVSPIRNRL